MRQIVLDTETTGLEPELGHRIIEIGCVELVDRRLTGNNFHQYLQPDMEIDPGAVAVHVYGREIGDGDLTCSLGPRRAAVVLDVGFAARIVAEALRRGMALPDRPRRAAT